jgi:choline dehydrogenase-like flavoprotein
MGVDLTTVVDARATGVHGIPGLRIADTSIVPSVPSGNINGLPS